MLKKEIKNLNQKLEILFNNLKIKKNDNIVIHSNFAGLLQFEKKPEKAFNIFYKKLVSKIGKKGSIVIPTYNYQFTKLKYFNYFKSPSEVGVLSNYFLKKFPNRRTVNPIFSHLLLGKSLKHLIKKIDYEIFGKKSIFSFFEKKNFKIFCFCCSPSNITYLHYLEKKNNVQYRFDKTFDGKINFKKKIFKIKIKYFVGKKKIDYSLKEKNLLNLVNNSQFKEKNFGRFSCYVVTVKFLKKIVEKELKIKSSFLIK